LPASLRLPNPAPIAVFRAAHSLKSLAPVSHRKVVRQALSQLTLSPRARTFTITSSKFSSLGQANDQGPKTKDAISPRAPTAESANSRERQQPRAAFWSSYVRRLENLPHPRFVVRAKQLTEPFTFTDTNGHEHHGRTGDYVIESRDGLRISRREIFEDVYVAMERAESTSGLCPERNVTKSGGHDFNCAEIRGPEIGALAPVQPPAEHANLPV
jgi:hypothetical protein